jgi:hypothetical protein
MTKGPRKSEKQRRSKMSEKEKDGKSGRGADVKAEDGRNVGDETVHAPMDLKWTPWTYNTGVLSNYADWAWIATSYLVKRQSQGRKGAGPIDAADARSGGRSQMSSQFNLL